METTRTTMNGRTAIFEDSANEFTVICGFTDAVTSEFRPSHTVKPRTFKTESGSRKFAWRFLNREMNLVQTRFAPEAI